MHFAIIVVKHRRTFIVTATVYTKALVVVVVVITTAFASFLSDWDLDTLLCEALAEFCAVANAWKFLGRIDLEDVAEDRSQNRRLTRLDRHIALLVSRGLDVDEGESEPKHRYQPNHCHEFVKHLVLWGFT